MNTIDYIYRDLKEILDTVVVKYDRKDKDAETVESRRESDKYINAKLELDTFRSHAKFSKDAIRNCGVFNEETVELYHSDKNLIPESMRDRVVKEERFLIIENYEEKNNYYRMLTGLPKYGSGDEYYVELDTSIIPDTYRGFLVKNSNGKYYIHEQDNKIITFVYSSG